jgi:hypothetical protein
MLKLFGANPNSGYCNSHLFQIGKIYIKNLYTCNPNSANIIGFFFIIPPLPEGGGGYTVLPLSVLPSVQDIFRRIFLSNYWWQESDIWSQASYRYAILWEAFLDPTDSYFLFADLVGFYTLNIYTHFSSQFSQQLLMAEIWYLVKSFI